MLFCDGAAFCHSFLSWSEQNGHRKNPEAAVVCESGSTCGANRVPQLNPPCFWFSGNSNSETKNTIRDTNRGSAVPRESPLAAQLDVARQHRRSAELSSWTQSGSLTAQEQETGCCMFPSVLFNVEVWLTGEHYIAIQLRIVCVENIYKATQIPVKLTLTHVFIASFTF